MGETERGGDREWERQRLGRDREWGETESRSDREWE